MLTITPNVPHYFFDDNLIVEQLNVRKTWLAASVFLDPVLRADKPWEGRSLVLYGSVLPDPKGGYRLYYSNFSPFGGGARLMLATSDDGFRWEKPELGLVEYCGSRANNIVIDSARHMDSPSVIFDAVDDKWPFKMIGFHSDTQTPSWQGKAGMYGYRSADGLRWEPVAGMFLPLGDRNCFYRDSRSGQYVILTRDPAVFAKHGRQISRTESPDFLTWSKPEVVLAKDPQTEPDIEYYGMPVFERHGWYFGLLEYWNRIRDVIEVHLVVSRDGRNWSRPRADAPFIGAAFPWNRAWNTCANNGPITIRDQLVFYFGGRAFAHGWDAAREHGVIGFASLAVDRFCAIEGAGSDSQFTTRPIEWPGGALTVNADTRRSYDSHPLHTDGEMAVEVLDGDGHPLPEWSGAKRASFRGNTHCRDRVLPGEVKWPGERSLAVLGARKIRLRFHLDHVRLFTITAQTSKL